MVFYDRRHNGQGGRSTHVVVASTPTAGDMDQPTVSETPFVPAGKVFRDYNNISAVTVTSGPRTREDLGVLSVWTALLDLE